MFQLTADFKDEGLRQHAEQLRQHLFPIEYDIVDRLHQLGVKAYREKYSDSLWTKEVKLVMLRLGQDEGFLTYPRPKETGFADEWMFDVVWLSAKSDSALPDGFDWRHTRAVKLACECEWGSTESQILEDFLKLTVVLAELRLFIYTNALVGKDRIRPAELCKRACPLSRGFRYLALGFPNGPTGRLQLDAWIA